MDALDSCHLDVGCGGGARDEGGWEGCGGGESLKSFRDGADKLIGKDNAEVVVGDERELAGTLGWGVLQDDGAGYRYGDSAAGEYAIEVVEVTRGMSISIRYK